MSAENTHGSVIGIIPARFASTRLPGKLLLAQTGRPLIEHTCTAASKCDRLSRIIVAADDEHIAEAVRNFGGECELTGEHPSGTDRIAEVVRRSLPEAEIIVNIQGDEPEVDPDALGTLVDLLQSHPDAEMATLCTPLTSAEDVRDPARVKVVCGTTPSGASRALYFSRAPIPHVRDQSIEAVFADGSDSAPPWKLHLGLYAYRRDFLLRMSDSEPSPLEELERLEQLRALEMGATILVGEVSHVAAGIDTPADYAAFVERQQRA